MLNLYFILLIFILIKKYSKYANISFLIKLYTNIFYINKIKSEKKNISEKILKDMTKNDPTDIIIKKLPYTNYDSNKLVTILDQWSNKERTKYKNKMSGTLYNYDTILLENLGFVFKKYAYSNPLHPDIYPSLRKMESEIISMSCDIFHLNNEEGCGVLTTGGTESIILAIKAYRDLWYKKTWFTSFRKPNIVVPKSIHAAFDKACKIMNIEIRYAKLNMITYAVDIDDVKNYIDDNTIMIGASAPCYPYGIIDPIEQLSELAIKKNIGFHVDSCLGGFILGLNNSKKYIDVKFDFILKGVTSLSADTHKYGYTPKGSSILLYRNNNIKKYQYSLCIDWTGGIYATPTLLGSRPGYTIACTWFTLLYHGKKKYIEHSDKIISKCNELYINISKIEELQILGYPQLNVISFKNNKNKLSTNKFMHIIELIQKENWCLNVLQNPIAVHICITLDNIDNCNNLYIKLIELIKKIKDIPEKNIHSNLSSIYGMSSSISGEHIEDIAISFLDSLTYI